MKIEIYDKFFHYNDILIELHPKVYDPAEDTFILLKALNVEKGNSVLEIGTGCGLIALECARIGANVVCTDINPYAIDLTKRNYERNKSYIQGSFEVRKGDLFSKVNKKEVFDIIIFNPPYLPTKKSDLIGGSGWFDVATNGGINGIEKTKLFIEDLSKYLKQSGHAYFVFSSLSNRNKLESFIKKRGFYNE